MTTTLQTFPRTIKGEKKEDFLPAVYYGPHAQSTPIFINAIEFAKVLAQAGESTTIILKTEHGDEVALIHDIQRHPVKHATSHVDFYVVEKGKKVHVDVPLEFIGEAPATKTGGILVKVLHELSIEADPVSLPHSIIVDLSFLTGMDSSITVADLVLPNGVTLYKSEETEVVAAISVAKEEEETPPTAIDMEAIEVEQKGKKEEEVTDTAE